MAILATEKILTLDYWKPAGKIEVGDYVFDRNGKIVQVKLAQQYMSKNCYQVMLNDWLSISGDNKLQLPIQTPKYRQRLINYKGKRKFTRPLRPMSVETLLEIPLVNKNSRKLYSIPTTNPLELPHKDLPVPAFVFGFWFFARKARSKMTAARGTTEYVTEKLKDHGYLPKMYAVHCTGEPRFIIRPTVLSQLIPNVPRTIPNNYLLASKEQRIDLLSGILCAKNRLLDEKTQFFSMAIKQYELARKIQMLAESLGCVTTVTHRTVQNDYVVKFRSFVKLHPNHQPAPLKVHYGHRFISKISPLPPQMCVHIETTGEDNTILVGEGFIPCL